MSTLNVPEPLADDESMAKTYVPVEGGLKETSVALDWESAALVPVAPELPQSVSIGLCWHFAAPVKT